MYCRTMPKNKVLEYLRRAARRMISMLLSCDLAASKSTYSVIFSNAEDLRLLLARCAGCPRLWLSFSVLSVPHAEPYLPSMLSSHLRRSDRRSPWVVRMFHSDHLVIGYQISDIRYQISGISIRYHHIAEDRILNIE